jgi:hypothetical protein
VFLVGAAGLVLLAHAVDVIQAGGQNWVALGLRASWAALLVVEACALLRGGEATVRSTTWATCVGTSALYVALLAVTGRSASPALPFSYVLAMILPLIAREVLAVALSSSALLLLGTWAILALDGARPRDVLAAAHAGIVTFAVAWMLALALARAERSAATQARARREALEQLRRAFADNEALVAELRDALASVKTLKGLLPVCAWCRRVRNDDGYWQQIEAYVRAHSEAEFSHAMCPECYRKEFPEES